MTLQRPTRRRQIAAAATGVALLLVLMAIVLGQQWRNDRRQREIARAITGGDPERAPQLFRRFGCTGCHSIPGIAGADGQVAPPLGSLRQRVFVGGVVRNTPDNLVRWIVAPQSLSASSAMPATGINPTEARDVAAYLYSH